MAPRAVLPTGFHVEVEEGVGPQLAGPGETQGGTVGHHQTIPQPPATLTQHSSGVLAKSQHFYGRQKETASCSDPWNGLNLNGVGRHHRNSWYWLWHLGPVIYFHLVRDIFKELLSPSTWPFPSLPELQSKMYHV